MHVDQHSAMKAMIARTSFTTLACPMIRHASPQVITRPSCRNAAKELLVAFCKVNCTCGYILCPNRMMNNSNLSPSTYGVGKWPYPVVFRSNLF